MPQRTLPGTEHPLAAYFARGSGTTTRRATPEDEKDYKEVLDRLRRKHDTARAYVPKPLVEVQPDVTPA